MLIYGMTFDHTTNYGSCFQAYALQQAIEKISICGENCSYSLIPIKTFKDYPVTSFIKKVLIAPWLSYHRSRFIPFEKKYMKYVSCSRMADLPLLNEQADVFVCGSDVIWNPDFNMKLGAFFLDFGKKYKFSYAASFGKAELNKEELAFTKRNLASFDAISVREKTSLEIAKKCTNKEVQVVADPVMLLTPEEWCDVMEPLPAKKGFIFVYTTHLNETFKSFIKKLESQTGLQVVLATCGPKQALKQGMLSVQTPGEWLALLKNADYVVTNSFHATVFSVMFHRKFFTVVAGDKAKGINMRMNDFLNDVGLGNRIYSSVPDKIDLSEIDYKTTDERIALMCAHSLAYIRKNLEAAYRQKNEPC